LQRHVYSKVKKYIERALKKNSQTKKEVERQTREGGLKKRKSKRSNLNINVFRQ